MGSPSVVWDSGNNFVTEKSGIKLTEDKNILAEENYSSFVLVIAKRLFQHKLNAWNGCLTNVYGIAQELIEKLSKAELPKDEYQCMNEPSPMANEGKRGSQSVSAMANQPSAAPHSMRSRRTATWAKPRHSDDGYSRCSNNCFSHLL